MMDCVHDWLGIHGAGQDDFICMKCGEKRSLDDFKKLRDQKVNDEV